MKSDKSENRIRQVKFFPRPPMRGNRIAFSLLARMSRMTESRDTPKTPAASFTEYIFSLGFISNLSIDSPRPLRDREKPSGFRSAKWSSESGGNPCP